MAIYFYRGRLLTEKPRQALGHPTMVEVHLTGVPVYYRIRDILTDRSEFCSPEIGDPEECLVQAWSTAQALLLDEPEDWSMVYKGDAVDAAFDLLFAMAQYGLLSLAASDERVRLSQLWKDIQEPWCDIDTKAVLDILNRSLPSNFFAHIKRRRLLIERVPADPEEAV